MNIGRYRNGINYILEKIKANCMHYDALQYNLNMIVWTWIDKQYSLAQWFPNFLTTGAPFRIIFYGGVP